MKENRLNDALNDSIDRLAAGQSIEECLRAYPDVADDLRLMLEIGETVSLIHASDDEVGAMRSQLDDRFDTLINDTDFKTRTFRLPQGTAVLLVASLMTVLVGFILLRSRESEVATEPTATSTAIIIETETPKQTETVEPTMTVTNTPEPTETDIATSTPIITDTPMPTACVAVQPEGWEAYQITSDDVLGDIVLWSGSTIEELMQVNCIEDPRIIVTGEIIYVPYVPDVKPTAVDDSGDNGLTDDNDSSHDDDDGDHEEDDDDSSDSDDGSDHESEDSSDDGSDHEPDDD